MSERSYNEHINTVGVDCDELPLFSMDAGKFEETKHPRGFGGKFGHGTGTKKSAGKKAGKKSDAKASPRAKQGGPSKAPFVNEFMKEHVNREDDLKRMGEKSPEKLKQAAELLEKHGVDDEDAKYVAELIKEVSKGKDKYNEPEDAGNDDGTDSSDDESGDEEYGQKQQNDDIKAGFKSAGLKVKSVATNEDDETITVSTDKGDYTMEIDSDDDGYTFQDEDGNMVHFEFNVAKSKGTKDWMFAKKPRVVHRTNDAFDMSIHAPKKLGKTRSITPEGYLLCEGVAIGRVGQQVYGKHELPELIPNGDGQIIVDRIEEEVFRPETLASFEGKDVTVEHPNEMITPETWKQHTVGTAHNVRRGSGVELDLMIADLLIKDPNAIKHVNTAFPQVSNGYNSDYEQVEPGLAIQRNIVGNHIALVTYGRAGSRCSTKDHSIDHSSNEVLSMSSKIRAKIASLKKAFAMKDQAAVEAHIATLDDEMEGESMDSWKKSIKDSLDAIDARVIKALEDRSSTDAVAEEAARKKKVEDEAAAKDTILNAEAVGNIIDLGKTYTGDAASLAPSVREVFSAAEVLSPGIKLPTTDALKAGGSALPDLMRVALITAFNTDSSVVAPFLMGRTLDSLKGDALLGVFNGAAALRGNMNSQAAKIASASKQRATNDFGGSVTPASINEYNRKHYGIQ